MTSFWYTLLFLLSVTHGSAFIITAPRQGRVGHPVGVCCAEPDTTIPLQQPVKCPDCDLCDGSGRILGGIAVVLPWWPIKAYRPCPQFIEKGGIYERSGQGLDEIAFGRDSTFNNK